jgi:hypothetical protein
MLIKSKNNIKILFLITVTLFCFGSANGYDYYFTTTPFDTEKNKLEPNYIGYDLERIYKELNEVLKKDEFESTEEYINRLRKKTITILSGLVVDKNDFIVSFPENKYKSLDTYKFDADKKTLNFNTSVSSCNFKRTGCYYISIKSDHIFGHGIVTGSKYVLAIKNFSEYINDNGLLSIYNASFKIPMDANIARNVSEEKSLNMLIIFKIIEPFLGEKIESFRDKIISTYAVYAYAKEIWFYNIKTGELYLKLKPNPVPTEQSSVPQEKSIYKCVDSNNSVSYQTSPCQ